MSAGFRFRLDPLLRLRRFALRRRLSALGAVRRELAGGQAREAEARAEAARVERREGERLAGGLTAGAVRTGRQAIEAWRLRAAFAARDVLRLEGRAASLTEDVVRERAAAESLERLRARAERAWRAERERRLQRELDDVAAARWARGRLPS
ncbi:MAG: flagellar FliJ family protein [Deltaproteobacteria bacterium]|nr:flagellar FliJ family protein [Deltaproteobacteria bacterium]